MSLIRQVWLLLSLTLALAFVGATAVSVHSARNYLQTQLSLKNNDTAQAIALSLSRQRGDPAALELAIASQFDTGYYERIRLVAPDGRAWSIATPQRTPHPRPTGSSGCSASRRRRARRRSATAGNRSAGWKCAARPPSPRTTSGGAPRARSACCCC
jgi:hypothetical protein